MSKQKRKLKKNQVALDNKIYDINHPAYGDIYENKIATGEVYWDEDSQQWLTTSPAVYVSPPKWNKKLSREKNEKIYQKWQEKNDPDYVANQVRKGTGSVARPLLDAGLEMTGGAGTYRFAQDPLKNLQGTANVLSYANLPGLAMHGLDYMQGKPFFNVTSEDLEGLGNTFDVAGLATLGAAPLIKQGLKVAPKILSSTSKGLNQGTKTLVRELTKNRMPDIPGTVSQSGFSDLFGLLKKSKFKNKESIDYVKNVTSDPRYAQKAKELDVKYSDVPTQERPVSNNSTLTDQQQTTGFNPFIQQLTRQQTGARRTQRNNPYRPSQMFGPIQDGHLFEDAAGPFTRMSNYTQTPNYYDKIFTNFNFGDEYLKKLNKNVDDLTPAEFEKFTKEQRKSGTFYMGKEDIQISPNKEEAIAHELKHKEHFNRKWEPTFPKKYTEEISKNFDKTGYPSEYTQYRLTDTEQEAWLSRDLKKSMVDKGYLKTPFDEIDEATLDKFIKQDNKIFTPELLKRLNKPNFLNWVNEALPAATGVTTVGAIGSQLMSQEESAPEQKAYGGKINNMKKNKLPKYQTGGPVDPILSNRLMQYLFGRNTNKPSILDVRSPNEYGVSLGDRFNIQSGLSFDPMSGMPSGYGKVGINNKGFNLGLEKRKGQSTFNVGYDSPNFNIGATYSNTNKMPSVGGNVGFNTKGFNVGVSGNYSPDNKNIGANIGYNNKGFNAGLNYDYSGQSSLSGNVGYGNDLFNVGLSGNYSSGDPNVNLNTTYNLGTRNKQKKEPIPLAFNTPEEIQLIKEDTDVDSNETAGPPKKSYGGKITNMKNNLPKMFWGGKLAPQLFDLAANTLINGTTYAVTDMIKAIREPEQEMRPTKRNTGFVMENGGMIKRADGSYSKRGLWDNIRANKGSGKKPTKQMLEQERKINSEMAFGGMIDPSMYMQQLMYGSYANGGQVPQNIPVEVEGGEAYELPNGEVGEFEGPSHDNGGVIPVTDGTVGLPEETKVYSKQLKVIDTTKLKGKNGKTMADRKLQREANVAKLEKILSKNPSDKFIKEALKRQQETAALEEQQDMAMQEQANQQQQMQQQAQQGMMQEQAMAGLMQDPAMMQQMGMMMYGGTLNKLQYGGEPIKPLPMKQIYDLRYPNKTIDVPYNERYIGTYSDVPLTEEMFPLQNNIVIPTFYDNNQIKTIPEQDPSPADLLKQKLNSLKLNAFISEPEGPQFTGSYVDKPKPPKSEATKKLERFAEFSPDYKMEDVYEKNVSGMPSDFKLKGTTIEEDEDLTNLDLTNLPPYFNTKKGVIMNPLYDESTAITEEPKSKKPNKFMNWLNKAADETGDFFTGLFDKNGKPKKEGTKKEGAKVDGNLPFTAGDYMGMAGTKFGALAPMTTTMLNRMMTPKNQNFFREYGAEGLRAMQEAQGLSAINRDKQLADIKLGEEASRQRGRNSARGVNTLRAMDISSDIAANQAQNQAYNSYAQQMMQLLGQKGQMENQQDQMVMQGEYQRDLADRQDVDQFYTNLAENFASQSELMQKQGRDMNQAQYNKMILQMSPMFSRYGIGMEMRNGEYVITHNGETIDQTKARLLVEKGIEAEKKAAVEATKKEGATTPTTTTQFNPLGLGNTPYFNPIFTDINIPTVTDKSLTKAAIKRRK